MSSVNFESVEYKQLSRLKKLAIFLITIGPETASQLLSQFDMDDIEPICKEIANTRIIDHEIQRLVMEEFSEIIGEGVTSSLGGSGFAKKALELSKASNRVSAILDRIEPSNDANQLVQEIGEMPPRQIYNLMRNEQAQTIAFLVSYLNKEKATEVISLLPQEAQEAVLEKIGTMEGVAISLVQKVVKSLKEHIASDSDGAKQERGGVRTVADIMNLLDKELGKEILANIEEKNPTLGGAIRKKMFSFDDLVRLSITDMQRVAREVEMGDLVVSMKSASAGLKEMIFGSVSKRAAETLKDELEMLGPVKLSDVEAAQDRIIQVVRKLDEDGEITLDPGGDSVIE